MHRRSSILLLSLIIAAACDRPSANARPVIRQALQGLIAYPGSVQVDVAAGEDAAQVVLSAPAPIDTVTNWFRNALTKDGWELASDVRSADGSVALSAQKGQRPLWITFRPSVGATGTTYTMIGAVVDSTKGRDSAK